MKRSKLIPPSLFLRFFRWFCHPKLRDHIEGDLCELHGERVVASGKRKADLKFAIDVLLLCRPGIIRPLEEYNLNQFGMFRSYFKIGWRNLLKNKGYAFINIGGLAAGMAVAMLIGLWIYDEVSFDTYHKDYDRIVRVMQHQTFSGVKDTGEAIPMPLENELRSSYGNDFKYLSISSWTDAHILSVGERKISKTGNYVQGDFPKMLSLTMIEGTCNGLDDPSSVMISASTAKALFGEGKALTKSLQIDNKLDVKVTGVYEDLPNNTTFRDVAFMGNWHAYVASQAWVKRSINDWGNNSFQLFGEVSPNANIKQVSDKIKDIKFTHSEGERLYKPEIFLAPMRDWHLRSEWKNGVNTGGRMQTVWLFGTIGVFVLLLACINFMNLSTARSEKRAKEVGIRMTIGSVKSQLINQFLSESFLVVLLAFFVTLGLVGISLSWFNMLADKKIEIPWFHPVFWIINFCFVLLTSLLAGSYPSLYLSSFQPVSVLKGTFKTGKFSSLPRKILVVIQFTVSVTLIIGTTIVYKQIEYSKNRPIGYDKRGIVMIQMKSPDFYGKYDVLQTMLKDAGAIEEMSESSSPITGVWSNSNSFTWQGKDPNLTEEFATNFVTANYGKTINWTIKEGRDFSLAFATDSSAIIMNEAAAAYIGVTDPIGMEVTWGDTKLNVIGVVKNIVAESPYEPVRQAFYLMNVNNVNWINLKLDPSRNAHESIAIIESVFKKVIPSVPFDYKFADDKFAVKFDSEERIGKLASVFATLAILISCLGLFGLASFVAEKRTKEIGVRKVLGASVTALWKMLSAEFILLVIISCLIAIPLSYYFLLRWLNDYTYHTEIPCWILIVTSVGAILITLLTVSFQAIKAALMNPVKSLRAE